MTHNLLMLGESIMTFPWYTWILAGLLVAVLIAYKMHKRSQM